MDVDAASSMSFLMGDLQSNAFSKLGSLLLKPDPSSQYRITQMLPEFKAHQAAMQEAKSGDVDERHPQYEAQSQKNVTMPQSANAASLGLSSKSTCTKPAPRTNRVVRPVGDPVRAFFIVQILSPISVAIITSESQCPTNCGHILSVLVRSCNHDLALIRFDKVT
jgi:hypothetical protein